MATKPVTLSVNAGQKVAYQMAADADGVPRHRWIIRVLDVASGLDRDCTLPAGDGNGYLMTARESSITLHLSEERIAAYAASASAVNMRMTAWAIVMLDVAAGLSDLHAQIGRLLAAILKS